ncbi:MAG TPA: hypothetical protein VGG74_06990 [Kofleriaceae bacterium]|jgi:hypothetical protein
MAQIRLVDAWLRSPASAPSHYRSVMVIAEKWAEQRVLMRAYAQSRDQTLPTILLHGIELAIGPAGIDVHGPWGIHVGDGPEGIEARAATVRNGLEDAARRLAGSKGNPPRLTDEEPTFDREPTGNWAPGSPPVLPLGSHNHPALGSQQPRVDYVAQQVGAARVPQHQQATYVPQITPAQPASHQHHHGHHHVSAPSNPELRLTPLPRQRQISKTRPPSTHSRTALGYSSGSGAQSAIMRLGLAPHVSAQLGRFVERIVPAEFHIDSRERRVLNALGELGDVTARSIGQLVDVADAVAFMEHLTRKLEQFGLGDLVEPGAPNGGEPTYRMRRQ